MIDTRGPLAIGSDAYSMWRRLPHPALAGAVIDLVGYEERTRGHFRQIEPASLVVPLVISFGEAFEIGLGRAPRRNDRQASFVAGLYGGPAVIDSFGACSCVQINFTPLGAYRFFGHPMHELAGTMVSADDVLGRDAWTLRDRLGDEPEWHRRFDVIERMLMVRLLSAPAPTPSVGVAYRRIVDTHGRASIAAIAAGVNCSRKHLAARFREEVGLTPKAVARIARFSVAVRLGKQGHGWADIAAECRYTDQPHFVREFAEFAGETPSAWRTRTAGR